MTASATVFYLKSGNAKLKIAKTKKPCFSTKHRKMCDVTLFR